MEFWLRSKRNLRFKLTHYPPPAPAEPKPKPKREPKPKVKNDPKLVAAARELRDRYLEQFNREGFLPAPRGKYDVGRAVAAPGELLAPAAIAAPARALSAPAVAA